MLATCRSPQWLSGLRRGRHVFTVRVATRTGGAGTSVAFTVGAASGPVVVSDRPAAATPLRTALVAFDAGGAATTCALDGGRPVACASPFGVLGLRPGAHRLVIAAGSHSALVAWNVVAPRRGGAPRVALVDRPRGGASSALFTWDSTAATRTTCTLDGRSARCASPRVLTRLRAGTHRFRVTVANAHGSARTTFTWTVGGVAGTGPSCGARRAGPGTYAHVVWIVMENHGYADVLDPGNAPYTAALAGACGSATDFHAETHPSLPNYVAMTSGDTQGVTDDADPSSHPLGAPSIFSLVGDWRALEEAMPSPCASASSGTYAVRHNPAAYYTGIRGACASRDVSLAATPDLCARFTFVTPDLCHDTHDCSVRTGDDWLAGFLPKVFASPQYRSGTTAVLPDVGRERRRRRQPDRAARDRAVGAEGPRGRRDGEPLRAASHHRGAARGHAAPRQRRARRRACERRSTSDGQRGAAEGAGVEHERVAVPDLRRGHETGEDDVVAAGKQGVEAAVEVGEGAVEHGVAERARTPVDAGEAVVDLAARTCGRAPPGRRRGC